MGITQAIVGFFELIFVGLFLAYTTWELYTRDIVVTEFITATGPMSIINVMFFIMLIFVTIGLFYAFLRR